MDFIHPWPSEITFKPYIDDKRDIIGRKWVFDKLEAVFTNSTYGVLLTADMGYGKTAIMSYLSCVSDTSSAGYWIRKHMVSFHMCMFDVLDTLKPDIFIRNIAGSIANKIPEYGNRLIEDRIAMEYQKSLRCSEDPLGCFDRLVSIPVSKLQHTTGEMVIAVDGLDECLEYESNRFNIVKILTTKITKMSGRIKLLVTSRRLHYIEEDLSFLRTVHLLPSDINNKRDIEEYLDEKLERSFYHTALIKSKQMFRNHSSLHQTIMEVSEGNFLFVKELLNTHDPSINMLPESLQHLYYLNFERVFGDNYHSFETIKPILEVIVAAYTPLDIDTLIKITNDDNLSKSYVRECLQGKLGHFFKHGNGTVMFHHKAMSDFLLSNRENNKYLISKESGHLRISDFFMKRNTNVIDAMQHMIDSNSKTIKSVFIAEGKSIIKNNNFTIGRNQSGNIIHKIARSVDSYELTKLLLKITGCQYIDVFTLTNVTAAFLASAYGNSNTLRALYECGADLNFTRHAPPIVLDEMLQVNHVEFCKHHALWGYNSLHIAAQHGHKNVVEFILQKSPDLLSSQNSMDLNSFQLAIEFGHTETARLLLKKNPSFADLHSLYYASKNNHQELVQLLLSSGVSDACLPCNGSMYWVNRNLSRYQRIFRINDNFTFQDDYRLLTCETALEVAVQKGNVDIVMTLLKQEQNTIHCRDSRGRTPLLTAVQYGRYEIFHLLLEAGASPSQICLHKQNVSNLQLKLSKEEYDWFTEQELECPLYASLGHLAAMFGREDILNDIPYTLLTSRDSTNATPMHYAVCHKHIDTILLLLRKRIPVNTQSSNGSTIFHTGAICGSYIILLIFEKSENYRQSFNILDYQNRSFMHHLFLSKRNNDTSRKVRPWSYSTDNDLMYFFMKSTYSDNFIDLIDTWNRTFIHYAALSGQVEFFSAFLKKRTVDDRGQCKCFGNKDSRNNTVIDLLYFSMPFFDTLHLHINCSLNDIFLASCNINHSSILSPHELSLWLILTVCHLDNNLFSEAKYQKYIKQAVKQNSLNSIIMLKTYARTIFHRAIQNIMPWILQNVLELDRTGIMVTLFLNDSFNFCDRNFEDSILHKVMYNEENRFWVHSPQYDSSGIRPYISFKMNRCFDRNGYNILHRAVIGGNAGALEFLLHRKLSLNVRTKIGKDTLSLFVEKSPYFNRESFFQSIPYTSSKQEIHIDEIRREIRIKRLNIKRSKSFDYVGEMLMANSDMKELANTQLYLNECLKNSYALSKVHILSAKGLKSLLEYSAKKYGEKILQCRNRHDFTTLYFAKIFGHVDTVHYLNRSNVKDIYPDRKAEMIFLLDILADLFDIRLTRYTQTICDADSIFDLNQYTIKLEAYLQESLENIKSNSSLAKTLLYSAAIVQDIIELNEDSIYLNEVIIEYSRNLAIKVISLIQNHAFISKFFVIRDRMISAHNSNKVIDNLNRLFMHAIGRLHIHKMDTEFICSYRNEDKYKYILFLDQSEKKNLIPYNEEEISLRQLSNLYDFDDDIHSLSINFTEHLELLHINGSRRFGISQEDFALYEVHKLP